MGRLFPFVFVQPVAEDDAVRRLASESRPGHAVHPVHLVPGVQLQDTGGFRGRRDPGHCRRRVRALPPGKEIRAFPVALGAEILIQPQPLQHLRQIHRPVDVRLSVVAYGDQQRVLHFRRLRHGPGDVIQPILVPPDGFPGLRAEGAVVMPHLVQIDQVHRRQVRVRLPDCPGRNGRGIIAESRLRDSLPELPEAHLGTQHEPGGAVFQRLHDDVFPGQRMHLREAPVRRRVFAAYGPQHRAVFPARRLHCVEQGRHSDMLPLPVPDPLFVRRFRLERLILPHLRVRRVASGDDRHMSRVGQRGKHRLHLSADGPLPDHPAQPAFGPQLREIRVKKGIQRNQYRFSHGFCMLL